MILKKFKKNRDIIVVYEGHFNPRWCIGIGIGIGIGRRVNDVTYCYNLGKMRSCILIRYRFTNKRRSGTIKTISLPGLAR